MTLVTVPLWLPHQLFSMTSSFPSGSSSLSCLESRLRAHSLPIFLEARGQAAISAGAHTGSGCGKICACRGREKFKLDVESRFPVPTLICHPHLMIRQAHLIAHCRASPDAKVSTSTLPRRPGMESHSTSLVPSCAVLSRLPPWGFFSPGISRLCPSLDTELSGLDARRVLDPLPGRPLPQQDGGHVARGPEPQHPAQARWAEGEQRAAKPPIEPPAGRHKRAVGATFQNGLLPISGWLEIQGTSRLE